MRRARAKRGRDKGASLVEFAMLMPLLLLLLFGIIEFGWVLGLNNDVRHGAREGARFAAVDGGSNAAINTYTCQSMEPLGGISFSDLDIELTRLDTNGVSGIQIGDTGRIAISADVTSLSGLNFMDALLPDTLSSTIDFRIEQVPSWSDGTALGVTC